MARSRTDRGQGGALRFAAALLSGGVLLGGLAVAPAQAVVILDSQWKKDGGRPGKEAAGFKSALALAAQPQFRGVLALSEDGESWGEASGTWLGNADGHAYILTAAHIYDLPASKEAYVVRAPDGRVLKPDRMWINPGWNGDVNERCGYDLVILRLEAEISGAGDPPVLYAGRKEEGRLITFVGYGSRGIGSVGEDDAYYQGSDKAAAQGLVEEVTPLEKPMPPEGDAGNYLGVWLPREDGGVESPYDGSTLFPPSPLAGLLGSGDSGGSAWMEDGGRWVLVGVNSNGSGNAQYGDQSWFTRVSLHRKWIQTIFPQARFQ
ncbi:serine protease family protein [Novispirillum itersonii]|uniref:hypothetical protein n=1 Tax=Novispirillum itersonii TaxID=189 RepID=UPI00036EACDE|nr:hypothetical protein [Novispirillum itersonii]